MVSALALLGLMLASAMFGAAVGILALALCLSAGSVDDDGTAPEGDVLAPIRVRAGEDLFCGRQIGVSPATGEMVLRRDGDGCVAWTTALQDTPAGSWMDWTDRGATLASDDGTDP